jgi:4-alpha-glucanotransferase
MDLVEKAARLGIEHEFVDALGRPQVAGTAILQAVVDAFPEAGQRRGLLPRSVVLVGSGSVTTEVDHEAVLPVHWSVDRNGVQVSAGEAIERRIVWPLGLPADIYRARAVDGAGREGSAALIVAPEPSFSGHFDRAWLMTVQLYSLRSETNWGIGDFSDLASIIKTAANLGAAGVGLNPLHALFDDCPTDCSPYSPSSRLFLNPIYINVCATPGFDDNICFGIEQRLAELRRADMVDYAAVASLKWRALGEIFRRFKSGAFAAEHADFDAFRQERGRVLRRYACFESLRRAFQRPWWEWPDEWRTPDDSHLDTWHEGTNASFIEYVEFLQWIAHRQLTECRDLAEHAGMPIGLYLDIAVGVKADGFDAWNEQESISHLLSIGAPPDQLNTEGQNWGLAGFNPIQLERQLLSPFRDMIAASMRYAGAIRLDHVLGLNRIYLVPSGFSARDGVYVRMPFDALLAVVAIESRKHQCVVIGEDLGTVPDGFREHVARYGVWSYRVLMFERSDDGSFKAAHTYPQNALVTFSTHDLPTFAGWKAGHDLVVKLALGLDPGETADQRHAAIAALDLIARRTDGGSDFWSVIEFLSGSPSRILAISIEDLLQVLDQPNVPGTINEHPNWRRRLPVMIDVFPDRFDFSRLRSVLAERTATSGVS